MATEKKKLAQVEAETQDEIAQIMSDIEGLQADLAETQKPAGKPPVKLKAVPSDDVLPEGANDETELAVGGDDDIGMADFRGSGDDASMEETLAGMKEEETHGKSLLDDPTPEAAATETEELAAEEEVIAETMEEVQVAETAVVEETVMKKPGGEPEGTLTMTLTGSMVLRLNYECDGQAVMVGFENGALKVELADGTEFKIPVSRTRKIRAA